MKVSWLKIVICIVLGVSYAFSDESRKCLKEEHDYEECPEELEYEGHLYSGRELEEIREAQREVIKRFGDMRISWEKEYDDSKLSTNSQIS